MQDQNKWSRYIELVAGDNTTMIGPLYKSTAITIFRSGSELAVAFFGVLAKALLDGFAKALLLEAP